MVINVWKIKKNRRHLLFFLNKIIYIIYIICVFTELPEITACNDSVDLSPNNPFMETQHRETPLDIALQTLQVVYFSLLYLNKI